MDVVCLCDDGNVMDSACLAAIAALKTSNTCSTYNYLILLRHYYSMCGIFLLSFVLFFTSSALVPSVDVSSDLPVVSLKHHTKLLSANTPLFVSFALLSG